MSKKTGRWIMIFVFVALAGIIGYRLWPKPEYKLLENMNESADFRNLKISDNMIKNIDNLCRSSDLDRNKVIASFYLKNHLNMEKCSTKQFTVKNYKKYYKYYNRNNKEEFHRCIQLVTAIYNDIKVFPVAVNSSVKTALAYENSYGEPRNYKSKYAHEGIDIMAKNNISGYYPVVSVADGVVENIGWLEKGGYRVGIRSKSGGYFYYAHLSSYSDIKKNDKVSAGTILGYMGDTGYSTVEGTTGMFDVHLHFGIYVRTKNYEELSVNPYYILKYLEPETIYY